MNKIYTPFNLTSRTAVVTGGAQGLGLGCARWLAMAGAQVLIADKNESEAIKAAASLPGSGHHGSYCDVTVEKDRLTFVEAAMKTSPTIDILVNNAGITHISPADAMDESSWRAVFDVNIHGMMFMSRDIGKLMMRQGQGSIINIGSIASLLAMPRRSVYTTTKVAVLGLTRALAVEWAGHGIRVNAVGPGYHKTPLLATHIQSGLVNEENIRRSIPMGRLGTIDDVGKAVVFFASPLSEYVTGQFLMVDGGYTTFGAPEAACA